MKKPPHEAGAGIEWCARSDSTVKRRQPLIGLDELPVVRQVGNARRLTLEISSLIGMRYPISLLGLVLAMLAGG